MEGRPTDLADADTAYGLARHKSEALARQLRRRSVTALAGGRRYLEAAGRAGIGRAVLSSSTSTRSMLGIAGLDTLVDVCVDGDWIRAEQLRSRPAPDTLQSTCALLGLRRTRPRPSRTVPTASRRAGRRACGSSASATRT